MNISETIKALPSNGRIYVDAGGRGQIKTNLTTAQMQNLITALESVEYELSRGDLIAGDVTRFSVKDALLKQVREALGIQ